MSMEKICIADAVMGSLIKMNPTSPVTYQVIGKNKKTVELLDDKGRTCSMPINSVAYKQPF